MWNEANDVKEGRGIYVFSDGSVRIGSWTNGKMNGPGVLYDCSGDVYQGSY